VHAWQRDVPHHGQQWHAARAVDTLQRAAAGIDCE